MGTSTDAILFYGYDFGDEPPESARFDLSDAWDLGSELAECVGFDEARPPFDDSSPETWREAYDAWGCRRKKALLAAGTSIEVKVVHYCSDGYPMYGLGIVLHRARRGDADSINVNLLARNTQVYFDRVKKAAELLGVDVSAMTPGFYLVSWWG